HGVDRRNRYAIREYDPEEGTLVSETRGDVKASRGEKSKGVPFMGRDPPSYRSVAASGASPSRKESL
ncbi:MAG: hypothetical protein QOG67_3036, partial [Verrucomicrobiota bacterium]